MQPRDYIILGVISTLMVLVIVWIIFLIIGGIYNWVSRVNLLLYEREQKQKEKRGK